LGKTIQDPPEADEQASLARLMSIIVTMFRQQTQPMLLLFEDLHWVKDGISLLSHLTKFIQDLPLVVVATFRDDEAGDLANYLPNMHLMSLKRLDVDTVSQLATNILGTYGQQEHVVDFLHRETEGNVFFLIEVIRTLAEQSGRLDQIGQATLPKSIFAQGIYTLIQHRLAQVSAEDRPYLNYMAVVGRGIDVKILTHTFPELDVESWLLRLTEVHILEVNNNNWRFAHDKLREVLLNQMPAEQLHQFHADIAETLETLYPNSQAGLIAYHLEKSLDFDHPNVPRLEKTIQALSHAADASWTTYANNQAMEAYRRVLELEKIHRQWIDESPGQFKPLDVAQVAEWHVRLGMTQFAAFMYSSTRDNLEVALHLLDQPMPSTTLAAGRGIMGQMTEQIMHRMFPSRYFNRASGTMRDNLTQIAEIINNIGTVYYMTGKSLNSLYSSLGNLNINERLGPSTNLAMSYAQMCLLLGSLGFRRMADYYYKKMADVLDQIKSPHAEAQAYVLTSVYYIGQVDYERVRRDIARATKNHLDRGDVWSAGYSRLIYATTFYAEGDYEKASALFKEILEIANEKRILQQGVFAFTWLARMNLLQGEEKEAQYKIEQALALLQEMQSNDQSVVDPWALAALIFLRNDLFERAYAAAETAAQLAIQNKITGQWGKHAFPALIRVYLELRDHLEGLPVDSAQLLQKAKQTFRSLMTLPDPMARVLAYYPQGRIAYLEGKTRQAYQAWERGILEAQKVRMPLEEGLCHQALGLYLPDSDPQKAIHREASIAIFNRLNAKLFLGELNPL
jgi:tetratricopeptide (TPR) repeat protein